MRLDEEPEPSLESGDGGGGARHAAAPLAPGLSLAPFPAGIPVVSTPKARPSFVPRSGYAALDALHAWRPGALTLFEALRHVSRRVVTGLLSHAEAGAIVIDGGNNVDVHDLVKGAKRAKRDPEDVLDEVRLARAFTAYQFQALLEDELPRLLASTPDGLPSPLVIVASFPDLYMDEDVAPHESSALSERAWNLLHDLAVEHEAVVIATAERFGSAAGRRLTEHLRQHADEVLSLMPRARRKSRHAAGLVAHLPKRGAAFMLPSFGSRQRLLRDYAAEDDIPDELPEEAMPTMPEIVPIVGPPMVGRVGKWEIRAARVRAEEGLRSMGASYTGAR